MKTYIVLFLIFILAVLVLMYMSYKRSERRSKMVDVKPIIMEMMVKGGLVSDGYCNPSSYHAVEYPHKDDPSESQKEHDEMLKMADMSSKIYMNALVRTVVDRIEKQFGSPKASRSFGDLIDKKELPAEDMEKIKDIMDKAAVEYKCKIMSA